MRISAVLVALMLSVSNPICADETSSFIAHAKSPSEFVLEKMDKVPIVIFGEAHWVREEVALIRDLIPQLPDTRARTIAVEVFPASQQELLDAIVSADEWREAKAMSILREAAMPHEEYLEIIEAVWRARRNHGNDALQLVALGPGHDFRERLPEGETYDSFMAARVKDALASRGGSILVYTGLHHAFTRYMQPETTLDGRARQYMIRMGNLLSWDFGERVFVITSHRPIPCGAGDDWKSCAPFGATIDCAASSSGRWPFAFDVASSPFTELRFAPEDLYSAGHPALRLVDFVDGLVWFAPMDELHQTRIIPLARYAPTPDALADVLQSNPFDDRHDLTRDELESLWSKEAARRNGPILKNRWKGVEGWRNLCAGTQP